MATATPTREQVFNLPNQLTAARFGLAIVLFVLIEVEMWLVAILVFALAALTDYLDGYFARKHNITSTLGRNLDPLVDKVLICGAFIFLLPNENSGLAAWMVTVVVARELIITSLRSFLENRGATFGADWLGKIKMVLQCAVLFAIFLTLGVAANLEARELAGARRPMDPLLLFLTTVQVILIYAMLAATALSGLQYLVRAASLLKVDPLS